MTTNFKESVVISDFGNAVREKRENQRKAQETLSEEVGVTRNTISNIELGKETKLSVAVALAKTLNLSIDNIFELSGDRDLNVEEFELFRIFRKLSEEGRQQLLDTAHVIAKYN